MKKNIGKRDRIVRLIIGIACLIVAFLVVKTLVWEIVLVIIGAFCIFESLSSWCLWNQIMGKNTCPIDSR